MPFQKGHKFFGNLNNPNYFHENQVPWNKGKKYNLPNTSGDNHYSRKDGFIHCRKGKKMSSLHYQHWIVSGSFKKGSVPWNKGKNLSLDIRIKLSIAHKGQKAWNKGKQLPQFSRENHPNWKGGISREPYDINFNQHLKERIRVRDNFICRLCGIPELECIQPHCVHHIDYDKKNSSYSNLILLCHKCHGKTNKNRNHWKLWFQEKWHIDINNPMLIDKLKR